MGNPRYSDWEERQLRRREWQKVKVRRVEGKRLRVRAREIEDHSFEERTTYIMLLEDENHELQMRIAFLEGQALESWEPEPMFGNNPLLKHLHDSLGLKTT